jgi:hypothetical protein
VKVEQEQAVSPAYNVFPGTYREGYIATPSPQPNSPLTFLPVSPAPHYNNIDNAGNILQDQLTRQNNQLQTPRFTQNNFHQQQGNQIYTPNIQAPTVSFANGSAAIWSSNMNNGNVPSANRDFLNSNTSPIFQPDSRNNPSTVITPNVLQNVNAPEDPRLSSIIFMDLDSQLLNNLSGELKNLSFSDMPMGSYSAKLDDKIGKEHHK